MGKQNERKNSLIAHYNSFKSGWNQPVKMSLILSAKYVFIPLFRRMMDLQDPKK